MSELCDEEAAAELVEAENRPLKLARLDDDALMLRARDGDREAYEVLVRRYTRVVIFGAARYLTDLETGRDVAQEVFLELWKCRDRYQPRGKFRGYLATLVFNRCRDVARRRGTERRLRAKIADDENKGAKDPSQWFALKQSYHQLHASLAKLDDLDREILAMRFGMELPYEEIASETGKPAGTLRSRVFHALRKLRSAMERMS